jgi:hypothetical protein
VCLTGLTDVEPLSESCSVSPTGTGLTGGAHRSDRCGSVDSRFGVPLRSRVGMLCVLVPRSSGTPVATWAWPTWVVSRRRVFGSRVHLVGVSISFEKNFYRLPFTPPSLVRRISPSKLRDDSVQGRHTPGKLLHVFDAGGSIHLGVGFDATMADDEAE